MNIEVTPEILQATVEAMGELQRRYEAEAAALAQLGSPEGRELAQERLEAASAAGELLLFYAEK